MKQLQEYLKLRARIYRLLGKSFYKEPTDEYLKELYKYLSVFDIFTENNDSVMKGKTILDAFYENIDYAEAVEMLSKEFARIFLSTGALFGVKSVIPQESVYLSSKGLAMQEERDEVFRIYCDEGAGRSDTFKEPEDHISAELGFMALLSLKTAELAENGELDLADEKMALQQKFLQEHILRWVPKMCTDLYNTASSGFYKGTALLTAGFLRHDETMLAALTQ